MVAAMSLAETLIAVWQQVLAEGKEVVRLEGQACPVGKTRGQRLRTVDFEQGDLQLTGIEQNPRKSSRWAHLARRGKRVMQFSCQGRYVGNVCEGRLTRYGAWRDLGLGG